MEVNTQSYFLMVFGTTRLDELKELLISSCEEVKVISDNTFAMFYLKSAFKTQELYNIIQDKKFDFILSLVRPETFAFSIPKNEITDVIFKSLFSTLHDEYNTDIEFKEKDIESMSEEEKNNIINDLIDKGVDNLTDKERELLVKLSKN